MFAKIVAELDQLRRDLARLSKIVRLGVVDSVNTTTCTVVLAFTGQKDAQGNPLKSLAVPWLQRSTEHRPPAVGDHAVLLDPSLGLGGGVAMTGWSSVAKPPAGGGGAGHVLYQGAATAKVVATAIELGTGLVTDYAANATKTDAEFARIWNMLSAWTPVANDGGAALKTLIAAAAPTVLTVAASQVKVK